MNKSSNKCNIRSGYRRIIMTCVLLFVAVANSSLFTFYSTLKAQAQIGLASHYSKQAAGAKTANGERLHNDSLTCAHPTYQFGTYLLVTHLKTDRKVVVRVNDRGPYIRGRIIDLSWGAARSLGILGEGVAKVSVHKVDGIVIPLAPTEHISFPKFEIESISQADTMKPIWQEDLLIDHKDVHRKMSQTNRKVVEHRKNLLKQGRKR